MTELFRLEIALLRTVYASFLCLFSIHLAHAQAFPSKPIRLIVPFSTGGPNDILARQVGEGMSQLLGQPVVVDNRPGAGGAVGLDAAAKAAPDGHTMAIISLATYVLLPLTTNDKLPYESERDLTPIGMIAKVPNVLAIAPSIGVNDLSSAIAYIKARPGQTFYASPGIGTSAHIVAEFLQRRLGLKMEHVIYKGSQPALVDLIGGRIQVMFALPVDTVQLAKDGRIKIVATADSRRSPVFPDVPTFHEAGVPDFEATSWFGLVVPSASPRAAMARLNEILNAVTDKADFRARLTAQGTEPAGGSIADVARFIQTEKIKWEPMVRASGAKSNQ